MDNLIPVEIIENKIYVIRGQKVILDKDLAMLYEVETKNLNKAVKRNIERFPDDFMFQLTKDEFEILRSQIVTSNEDSNLRFQFGTSKKQDARGGQRYLPYVFTEHGVAMLSSVLRSKRAVAINIQIVRIFNRLRNLALEHKDLRDELIELKNTFIQYARENNLELEEIYQQLDYLKDITKPSKIGFKG